MRADPTRIREELNSGKTILREFSSNGSLTRETQAYGVLDIAVQTLFEDGRKTDEMYFVKRRLVSRQSYEKARMAYADMPAADSSLEDFGRLLMRDVRCQQLQNKAEAEQRLAESSESRFPRPPNTNWLRVIAGDKAHLVVFASRDWKLLSRERTIPSGRGWLQEFGFLGPSGKGGCVAEGLVVGFEVVGNREAMLNASRKLLVEVVAFVQNPSEATRWSGSIRPRSKPRKQPRPAWPEVLPPLIEFLSNLKDTTVMIFNHHR